MATSRAASQRSAEAMSRTFAVLAAAHHEPGADALPRTTWAWGREKQGEIRWLRWEQIDL
jgi:hypothetical protein